MILLNHEIKKAIEEGKILYDGNINNISINSIDVTLSKYLKVYFKGIILKNSEFDSIYPLKFVEDICYKSLTKGEEILRFKIENYIENQEVDVMDILKDFKDFKIKKFNDLLKEYIIKKKYLEYIEIFLDIKSENKAYQFEIPNEGIYLLPDILYLGSTNEKCGSDYYIPMYEGRSSTGRIGLESHISAGFGDLGFKSNWTLEITVVHPLKIYEGFRIGQVYFYYKPEKEVNTAKKLNNIYKGKYIKQSVPQESLIHKDFKN